MRPLLVHIGDSAVFTKVSKVSVSQQLLPTPSLGFTWAFKHDTMNDSQIAPFIIPGLVKCPSSQLLTLTLFEKNSLQVPCVLPRHQYSQICSNIQATNGCVRLDVLASSISAKFLISTRKASTALGGYTVWAKGPALGLPTCVLH